MLEENNGAGNTFKATASLLAEAIDYVITDDKTMTRAREAAGVAVRGTMDAMWLANEASPRRERAAA
jgi:hypothetical protein